MKYRNTSQFTPKPLVQAIRHAMVCLAASSTVLAPVAIANAATVSETSAAYTATQLVRQFTLRNTVAQANEALQTQVADVSGTLKGASMGATVSGLPSDMGTVPSGIGVPQRDGAGRLLGYCAWDNSTGATTSTSYLAGNGTYVYAVVSPGLDGRMDTSCAYVLANGVGQGDDYLQVRVPAKVSATTFKTAVSTASALPAGSDGDIRLVQDSNMLYSYKTGTGWGPVSSQGPFSDDSSSNGSGALSYTLGKVTVADFQASTATVTGNLAVGGTSAFTGALTANNGITVANGLTVSSGGASITGNTSITGTLSVSSNTTVTGSVTATSFSGNGSALTNLNASNISSGTLGVARGGTGVDASSAVNGALLIGNGSGFSLGNLTGTTNQVVVSNSVGGITLSLPQSIATTSTPTFGGLTLNGALSGTSATYSGNITAQRLIVGDSTGGVVVPNIVIGSGGLQNSQSGDGGNIVVGVNALAANTSGSDNIALGLDSLSSNTTGNGNAALGYRALYSNVAGNSNAAFGVLALNSATGSANSGLGVWALGDLVSGDGNTGVGQQAGVGASVDSLISGSNNTFLGAYSSVSTGISSVNYATVIGSDATVSTSNTVVLGRSTDSTVIGATGTASSGILSGKKLQVTGDIGATGTLYATGLNISGSTSFNSLTLTGALTGTTATFSGAVTANSFSGNGSALTNLNASNISSGTLGVARGGTGVDGSAAANGALLIGNGSGFTLSTLTGTANQVTVTNSAGGITLSLPQNIATTSTPTFGGMTLSGALTGTSATYSGNVTAQRLIVGDSTGSVSSPNIVIGSGSMQGSPSGTGGNIAIGVNSLVSNTSGFRNIALGRQALNNNSTGSLNLAMGYSSLGSQTTGNYNAGIGPYGLTSLTSGSQNTSIGAYALDSLVSGSDNVGIGTTAGKKSTDPTNYVLTSGNNNTFIGSSSAPAFGVTTLNNATAIGAYAEVGTDSTVVLGRTTDSTVIGATGKAGSGILLNKILQVTGNVGVSGSVTATSFVGDGSGLTGISAANIGTGTLSAARGGTGVDGSAAANGALLIGNGSGFTLSTLTGTANQVVVTNSAGGITLSLPQSIATTSSPTFTGLTLSGALSGATTGSFSGAVTASSFSGSGASLTNLNASNISSGTLGVARGGTGVDGSAAVNGALLIGNGSGFTLSTLTGTTNQVTVTNSAGGITLSLPQNIATTSTPTFGGMTLSGALTGTSATYSGNVTAQRLILSDSTGGVTTANIVIGSNAMNATPSGGGANTAVGLRALMNNTSGQNNVALGTRTLETNTTGSKNTALGAYSMFSNTTATDNVAVGEGSLYATSTGADNTALGSSALFSNVTGQYNTGVGRSALVNATGTGNSVTGAFALSQLTSGDYNTGVGIFTGARDVSRYLTSGSSNTFLGAWSGPASGVSTLTNATAIGANAEVGTDNTIVLGRTTDSTVIGATGTAGSGILSGKKLQVTGDVGVDGTLYATGLNISGSTSFNSLTLTGALTGTTATFSGAVTASSFSGSGASLTNLNASNVSSGTLSAARGGTGVDGSAAANGALLIGNGSGFTLSTLTGTANQVVVTNSAGGITLSLPQNIATTSTPTFGGMTLNGALSGTTATFSGAVTANSFSGNGSALTNLNASNISSGTLAAARGGTGVDGSAAANGALLIGNGSGFTLSTLTGTANQVVVTNSAGGITLSLPQSIATTSTPTFGALTLNGRLNITDTTGVSSANVIIGTSAMAGVQSGAGANTAVGSSVLNANTSGASNTGVGRRALLLNTTGSTNVAVGAESLKANTTGNKNVALGYTSLDTNTTGSNNTALGYNADTSDVALSYATALGSDSVVATSSTVVLGRTSDITVIGATGTAGSGYMQNTKLQVTGDVGISGTLYSSDMNLAGSATVAGTLTANRLIALDTNNGLTVGNVVIGSGNLNNAQSGYGANIAIGVNAMASNTTGDTNIAIGEGTMYSNTTGLTNTAVGGNALYSNTTNGANAAFGYRSLESATSGDYNAAFGAFALDGLVSGSQNVGVGTDAGSYFDDANYLLTNGSNNTFLGSSSSPTFGVHTLNYATVVGSEAEVGTSNTVVLGRTSDTTVIGATGTASSGVLNGKILQVTGNVGVSGTGTSSGGWTTSSDIRLKTDVSSLGDDILAKLSSLNAYQYRYIADQNRTQRYGVIAQEVAALFPNAVMSDGGGYLAVDYGAIGAIAAAGVGKLNKQFIALNNTVTEHGTQIKTLESKLSSVDERVVALEGWRAAATTKMDGMQKAIDLNITQIAEHALKIAANTENIIKLETVVGKIDERVHATEGRLDKVEGKWASTFTHSEDGQTLVVNTPNLIATNFTAQQLKAKAAYTERLEAEMARIRELEVDNLKANNATARNVQAGNVQAATVNTGSTQVYVAAGFPAFLFSATEDGHYTLNTSAVDGSYATATVIVNLGQVKVITIKSEGIDLIGDGGSVKAAVSSGKMIRASWTKTG